MASSAYDSDSGDSEFSTESNDSDDDYVGPGKRKRKIETEGRAKGKRAVRAPPKPRYLAVVTELADDGNDTSQAASSVSKADSKVLEKIRKAMELANHPGTGEAEARLAMRMAMKLMATENISQADLIANESVEERSTRAGHSAVSIKSTLGKSVRRQRWHNSAYEAACEAFDVQVYSETYRKHLAYVFYGLASNTVAAAMSFEMLHNQIETWAMERRKELKGLVAGNSYRLGVAERVFNDALEANRQALKRAKEEDERRIKQEEEARAAEIARLNMPVIPESEIEAEKEEKEELKTDTPKVGVRVEDVPDEDSQKPPLEKLDVPDAPPVDTQPNFDSDDDEVDLAPDFDYRDGGADDFDLDALEEKIKSKAEEVDPPPPSPPHRPPSPSPSPVSDVKIKAELDAMDELPADPRWTAVQLRTFKDNAKTIADDYLKATGTKLRTDPKLKSIQHDRQAFRKGWEDGRKVDLKRRRIEDEILQCKVEPED